MFAKSANRKNGSKPIEPEPHPPLADWVLISLCEMMEQAADVRHFDDGVAQYLALRALIGDNPALASVRAALDGLALFDEMIQRARRWSEWQNCEPNNTTPCPPLP